MKKTIERITSTAILSVALMLCASSAGAGKLGEGITAYYDCETPGSSAMQITVAGKEWDSSSASLVSGSNLLFGWSGNGIGSRGQNYSQKFSNCYSGGGTWARCYESRVCAELCPGTSSGDDWTFSFWVVRNNATTQRRLFVNSQNVLTSYSASDIASASAVNAGFGIYLESNGKIGVRLSETIDGSAFNIVSIVSPASYTWNASTWHNVIVSRAGDTLALYVDGELASTAPMITGSYLVDPSCLTMAEDSSNGIGQENGADDFCVWNRALTSYERGAIAMGNLPISALAGETVESYKFSNADGSALRWDGGYNNNSGTISFTLSNPSGVHAASGFPKSGLVALTCISIGSRKDAGDSTPLDHVVMTAANGKSYTSSRVEILDGKTIEANRFITTLASGGVYGEAGSYGQGGGRKTINIYFDSVAVDVTSALTLATYTSADATGQLGSSVVASTTTGTDWKPAMRIYGEDLTTTPVTRTIAENADVSWADAAWTVGGEASQSFSPSSDTAYDVTITVNGDCTITMPSSIGSFTGCEVKFELGDGAASANVTLKYPGSLPADSATTVTLNPFGTATVTAGTGVTLNHTYDGDFTGYVATVSGAKLYVAKRPDVGVYSVRIGWRGSDTGSACSKGDTAGYIDPSYSAVGPYPIAGSLWNHTKVWRNNSTSGTFTDIQSLTDAADGTSTITMGYYGRNSYYNNSTEFGNDFIQPNGILTATYIDDSDSGSGALTATDGSSNITLPAPGHTRGWQLHFEGIPFNAYDVYFITASDVSGDLLKETPIYVSLDGGTTWKTYVGDSANQKTVMGTGNWSGLPCAQNGNLVEGRNYIKMRITKSIYGDNIGTIDITHGARNTGSKIRSGLAAIQIVEVENDGVYTLNTAGNWSDNIWDVGALTDQNWADTVDGAASIAKIESSATIDSVTVDAAVSAGSVILTGSDPFTVAGSSTLTVSTGFDASAFTGELNLQAPISGTIYIGANTTLEFGGDSNMSLPAYTLDGAGAWTKVGTGVLTVNNGLALAGTVTGGTIDFTTSSTGNITLNGGNLKFTGGESEILYDGMATLANNGTGKTIIQSGTVQSRGSISTDIDVNNGAVLKLGATGGFGSSGDGAAASGKTITVNSGGVVELNGNEGCNAYTLNGGTLRNTGTAIGSGQRQTMGLTLTADSTVQAVSEFGLVNTSHNAVTVSLGGHKLTKTGSGNFIMINTTVNGTSGSKIEVTGGTLKFPANNKGYSSTVNVPVSVDANTTVQVDVASEIQSISGAGSVSGSAMLTTSGLDLSDGLTVATPVTLKSGATVKLGTGSISGTVTLPSTGSISVVSDSAISAGSHDLFTCATTPNLNCIDISQVSLPESAVANLSSAGNKVVLTVVYQRTVTVPSVANTAVTVTADDVVVAGENGVYTVFDGQTVVVTYAAVGDYALEGTTAFTFASISENQEITAQEAPTATAAVAKIGTDCYASLSTALQNIGTVGTIDLVRNSSDAASLLEGVTLKVANGVSYTGSLSGAGTIEYAQAPADTALPVFVSGENGWSGTFVVNWDISGRMILDKYGISKSTVKVAKAITSGYFNKNSSDNGAPTIQPIIYFDDNVTISDGFGGTSAQLTTFTQIGMADGKAFATRGNANSATPYAFTVVKDFDGTINVRASDSVKIGTLYVAGIPTANTLLLEIEKATNASVLNGSGKNAGEYPVDVTAIFEFGGVSHQYSGKAVFTTMNSKSGLYFAVAHIGDKYYATYADAASAWVSGDAIVVDDASAGNIPEGWELTSNNTRLTKKQCAITLGSVTGISVSKIEYSTDGGDTWTTIAEAPYSVPYSATVRLTYAANGAYVLSGTSETFGAVTSATTLTPTAVTATAAVAKIGSTYYVTLQEAIAAASDESTVTLLENISLTDRLFVNAGTTPVYGGTNNRYATTSANNAITLDLNGHDITTASNIALAGGSLTITGSGTITTTNGGAAPVEIYGKGDLSSKRTLVIDEDVRLVGGTYGLNIFGSNDAQVNKIDVTVNGTITGTLFVLGNLTNAANEINIVVNGTIAATASTGDDVNVGVALNGNANVTVNEGASISGDSGIEVRAGSLTVNGGTITATAQTYSYKPNGSGSTTKGAAIAIAQHTTVVNLTATLSGGTLVGAEQVGITNVNGSMAGVTVQATSSYTESAEIPAGYKWVETETPGVYTLEGTVGTTFTVY